MLAGKFTSHQDKIERQSHACLVSFDELNDTQWNCFKLPQIVPFYLASLLYYLSAQLAEDQDWSVLNDGASHFNRGAIPSSHGPRTGGSDDSNEEVSGNYPDSNEHGAEAIEGKEEYGEDSYSGEDDDDCESVSDRTSCSSCDTSHVSDIDLSYNSEVHHQDNDSIPLSPLSYVGGGG